MNEPIRARTREDDIAEYRKHLAEHDWHYERADDQRVWRAGLAQRQALLKLRRELDPTGALWNEYAPEGARHG